MADLIDRQAAIDALVNSVSEIGLHDNSEVARYGATFRQHEIIDIIEGLPSAQQERPKGEWVLQSDDYHEYYECDQCGMAVGLDDVRNFCCNCGADMRGEQDG